jgi:hypothetical protein
MNNKLFLAGIFSALMLVGSAGAQATAGSGSIGVSATVQGSINLTFVTDANGLAVTGTTTSAASLPLGTISMYGGTVPANVTKTINGFASFNLATPFDILVNLANSPSTAYTLAATLSSPDSNRSWLLGAIDISSGTSTSITGSGVYATAVPYVLNLLVPAGSTAGAVANTINFTATAN